MKKLLLLTMLLCSILLFSFSASAQNRVVNIDADIIINDDGSADFYQTWQCNFDKDTEVYYFFPDEGRYEISDFVVWDEDKTYETVSDWDTSLSFMEKAGKCGVLEYSDGYELCWGITEYGAKTYNIYFKIDNLVTAYKDADATYFCLFSDNVNTRPTYTSVRISLANGKKLEDASIFTDGEFISEGNCSVRRTLYEYYGEFEDGAFVTKTDFPMTNVDQMAFSFVFEKGLINPTKSKGGSAEKSDDKYFNKYVDDSLWEILTEMFALTPDNELAILVLGLLVGVGLPLAVYLMWRIFYRCYVKSITKKPEINRNPPAVGLEASYLMLKDFKLSEEKNLLTLIFLDMMDAGAITPILPDSGDPIPVAKGNVKFRINPVENTEELDETKGKFYKFLSVAAKDDKILDPYEIKVKSQDYFYTLSKIMDTYTEEVNKKIETSAFKRESEFMTGPLLYKPDGKAAVKNILGYKRYLMEYSTHNAVNILDYDLWQAPMRYAVIFGETEKIKGEILKAYPSSTYEMNEFTQKLIFAEQAAKLMAKGIAYSRKNYRSGNYRGGYYRTSTYRGSSYRGGGFRGGGGTR